MKKLIKPILKSLLLLAVALIYFLTQFQSSTMALSPEQKALFVKNIGYFDISCSATGSPGEEVTAGEGAPDGAAFPALDPAKMADAINKYVKKNSPSSKLKNLGTTIVAGAKHSNINPFLIIAIAQKESNIADPTISDNFNVVVAHNAFGRTATPAQPHVQGAHLWYKWSSVKASVDYSAGENQGVDGGGDIAAYLRAQYKDEIDKSNLTDLIMKYAPPGENDTSQYIADVRSWLNDMIDLTGTGTAPTAAGGTGPAAPTAAPAEDLNGKNVYMVGDSITDITKPNLTKAFKGAGATPHIDATGGSSIVYSAAGRSGLEWIDFHKSQVKHANIIVIAHGTNEVPSQLEGDMKKMMNKVKSYNDSAGIYWVNTFTTKSTSNPAYTAEGATKKNAIMDRLSTKLGYKVIDAKSANIKTTDGIHPFNDKEKYAKTVVEGVTQGAIANTSADPAQGCCLENTPNTPGLSGKTPAEQAFNFFVSPPVSVDPKVAAGIVGNMMKESGGNTENLDTHAHNDISGTHDGIVQWSTSRWAALQKHEAGKDPYDLAVQLDYVWYELVHSYGSVLDDMKKAKSAAEAATIFNGPIGGFESSGDTSGDREKNATDIFNKYGGGAVVGGTVAESCGESAGDGALIGDFAIPVPKKYWDNNFDWFTKPHHDHPSADIPVPSGTDVYSITSGKVLTVESTGDCGTGMFIDAGQGVEFGYCHGTPGSTKVKAGDTVDPGQLIMLSDNTGFSTGPHLHVQIKLNGALVCPQGLFKAMKLKTSINFSDLPTSGCTN